MYHNQYFDDTMTTPSTSSSSAHSHQNELPIATSKWHTWAKEEIQLQKTESHSPKITHIRPPQIQAPPKIEPKVQQPTKEQLQIISVEPPHCFCKKEAHRCYTLEYGPILECASYGYHEHDIETYKRKYTCGFHVHEISWNKFRIDLKNGHTIQTDYPELRSCPLYNFTFCTIFYATNHFDKVPPAILPNCFCGHPVKLREGQHRIYFSCRTSSVEGAKKCSWKLDAREIAFTKPKHRLHTFVDLETYHNHLDNHIDSHVEKLKSPLKSQHQNDLLATLSAKPNLNPTNNLIVPTSVLAKKRPSVSLSCSSSTSSTASSSTMNKAFYDLEEARILNSALRSSMMQTKQDAKLRIKEVESKLAQCMEAVAAIEMECKEKVIKMQLELQQEYLLRISSQERLSSIEINVVDLMNQKEKITEELVDFRESTRTKYGKEEEFNKCKVCFHRSIEYVLLPCFHFGEYFIFLYLYQF